MNSFWADDPSQCLGLRSKKVRIKKVKIINDKIVAKKNDKNEAENE